YFFTIPIVRSVGIAFVVILSVHLNKQKFEQRRIWIIHHLTFLQPWANVLDYNGGITWLHCYVDPVVRINRRYRNVEKLGGHVRSGLMSDTGSKTVDNRGQS